MEHPRPETITLSAFLAWETEQLDRYEWLDGIVVPVDGVSDDHAAINANLMAVIRPLLSAGPCFVRGSDRKLVPFNEQGAALGSFYSDLFVSCAPEDRKGGEAHYPTLVVEILSEHGGGEFTKKRDAYMRSAKIQEYVIIDSTRQYVIQYLWTRDRHFAVNEYYRGPLKLTSINLEITFAAIYADTNVQFVIHPVHQDDQVMFGR